MVKSKSLKIVWDRHALDDLQSILEFLFKQSPEAPKIIKSAILTRLKVIQTNAFICESDKLKDKPDDTFRAFVVYSYRITYQINHTQKEIRIIRVRHTSREPLGY
jgi:plasmid stabilization system protein ParE